MSVSWVWLLVSIIRGGQNATATFSSYQISTKNQFKIRCSHFITLYTQTHTHTNKKAQAALMYDAVFVLVEAFNKLLRKKPDQFRSYTMRNRMGQLLAPVTNVSSANASNNANANRVLDCNTSKGWVNPWEHGDKISRYLRKVCHYH